MNINRQSIASRLRINTGKRKKNIHVHDEMVQWAIPENIHTIRRTAFRISEGEGGSRLWNSEGNWGVFTIGNPKAWGISQVGFPE